VRVLSMASYILATTLCDDVCLWGILAPTLCDKVCQWRSILTTTLCDNVKMSMARYT